MATSTSFNTLATGKSCKSSTTFDQPSVKKIEGAIAAIDATQIKGIAKLLVADVMDRLQIDIQWTNSHRYVMSRDSSNRGRGTTFVCGKVYDPHSKLMTLLLPIFIERITKAFSLPSEFVQNGLVFDFLNHDKTGLLDRIEDETLQKNILKGMSDRSAYYLTLKIEAGESILLKTGHYMDKNWVASRSDSIQGFVASSSEDFI